MSFEILIFKNLAIMLLTGQVSAFRYKPQTSKSNPIPPWNLEFESWNLGLKNSIILYQHN